MASVAPLLHPDIDDGDRAIRSTGLTKMYGTVRAVDGLDLDVPRGSITGIVGPNGAGKTTTIRTLLGLIGPSGGSAEVLGGNVSNPAAYLSRVGSLIEGPAFHPALSGRRNLRGARQPGRVHPSSRRRGAGDRRPHRPRARSVPPLLARHEAAPRCRRRAAARPRADRARRAEQRPRPGRHHRDALAAPLAPGAGHHRVREPPAPRPRPPSPAARWARASRSPRSASSAPPSRTASSP